VSGKSYLVAAGKATVAVLQGSRTASSGEALVVAFRSRQNTRSFGHATAGLSSANESIVLDDGAVLFLTVAVLADRSGKVYGAKIDPDYVTEGGRANAPLPDDPDVKAASAWLRAQPSCTGQSS
jgi:C-terminal processing protease CtpA/Prc